jgi:hypothetical protein
VIAGAAVGLATLAVALVFFPAWGMAHNGPWAVDPTMGSSAAGPYSRAWTAIFGVLAVMPAGGGVYFLADHDSTGAPLSARCTYFVAGNDPDAPWWSITVYRADGFLLRGTDGRYSMTRDSVPREPDGSFRFRLAATGSEAAAAPGTIPTGGGGFNLELRIYAPGAAVLADLARVPVPTIVREACR